jgi:hypothetical protein
MHKVLGSILSTERKGGSKERREGKKKEQKNTMDK